MRLSMAIAIALLSTSIVSAAEPAQAAIRQSTSIPAQRLGSALQTLAEQRAFQVVYLSDAVDTLETKGASGDLTSDEALEQLLSGTGLSYRYLDATTVTVFPAGAAPATNKSSGALIGIGTGEPVPLRLAQVSSVAGRENSAAQNSDNSPGNPQSSAEEPASYIQEVIVTATKRAEGLQDIPISIAVIGGEDIERRGLIGMGDYLRSIPSVNQVERGYDNAIVIRGITTQLQQESGASGATVATYFGEAPITGSGGLAGGLIDVRPVDIERIEVLRGPQGTAYGSSSLGGTLRIIPKQPDLDRFGGNVAASYSDTSGLGSDNSMMQGVLNAPLIEGTLAVRAVAYRYDQSGFVRNIAGQDPTTIAFGQNFGLGDYVRGYTQDDVGRALTTGGRLSASWQPTENLNLTVTHLTQDYEQDGRLESAFRGTFDQRRFPVAPQARTRGESGEIADANIDLTSAVLNYDLGWGTLTSSASWIDSGSIFVSAFGPIGANALGPSSVSSPSEFQSFSTETRLASNLEGRLQFLGGVFYEDVKTGYEQTYYWPGLPQNNPAGPNPTMGYFESERELDQRAVFGEVSYDLTDKLTATVGGRYFTYDKRERSLGEGGLAGVPLGAGVPINLNSEESDTNFKASLNYEPTEDSLLYASWAQGFRLGRPQNTAVLAARCDTNNDGLVDGTSVAIGSLGTISSDFLDNYELGGKFSLLERRLVIDTAVYHIEWDGLPATQLVTGCTATYTANAGAATSDGVELQASLLLFDGLRIDFGGAYTKAELAEDVPPQGWREGDRLPGSPKVSANLAAQYEFDMLGHRAFVRADSFYTGEFYANLLQSPVTRAGDYIMVDARTGIAIRNLSVELFVRNLTNEDATTWQSSLVDRIAFQLRPRTLGIQLGYEF